MTGGDWVQAVGPCMVCGGLFAFNPNRVPSHRRTPEAPREPICRSCMDMANRLRVARGDPPHPIHADAYDPMPAAEL